MHHPRNYWICVLTLLTITACKKTPQSKEAVEQGLMEHLQNRVGLNTKNMDINVSSVSFRQNEAEATVTFQTKGSTDAAQAMKMRYVLEQKDGKWVVKGKSGGSDHSGGAPDGMHGAAPGAMPGIALPPGHPPAAGKPGAKP